jgi:hypothetical protein
MSRLFDPESATVPAGDVKDPERTIPRSTIIGITIAMLLYVLGPSRSWDRAREQLVKSVVAFRCGPDTLGTLGSNRDLHRSYPVVDWRAQRLTLLMASAWRQRRLFRPSSPDSPSKVPVPGHRLGDPVDWLVR